MKKGLLLQLTALLAGIFCIMLTSCVPGNTYPDQYNVPEETQRKNTYYVPAAPHIPLLYGKGDINVNVMRASGKYFVGLETQLAYMTGKNFSVGASGSTGSHDISIAQTMNYTRYEAMIGYIKNIDKTWHFETYAGLGTGKIKNDHFTGRSKIKSTHFFLQPAIAASNENKSVQFVFASRFTGVNLKVTDTSFATGVERFSAHHLNNLYDKPFQIMWEPTVQFRTGWQNVMFNAQYSYAAGLTNPDLHRSKYNFSFGVTLRANFKRK